MTTSTTPKPGRNEPCHCGSGRKYKQCCLPKDEAKAAKARAKAAAEAGPVTADSHGRTARAQAPDAAAVEGGDVARVRAAIDRATEDGRRLAPQSRRGSGTTTTSPGTTRTSPSPAPGSGPCGSAAMPARKSRPVANVT